MPFRPKKKQPEFADLKGVLNQSGKTDNALHQAIQILIERLTKYQLLINEELDPDNTNSPFATKFASYITKNSEIGGLPNSWQLIAGPGIVLDDSVPHELVISSAAGNTYDSPLSDGDLIEAHLIFADGDPIIVQVPIP